MIPRFEFGHLSKFIVSVGLVLVAASIAGPFFIQQSLAVLLVTRKELSSLTSAAQRTVELRQERVLLFEQLLPWIAIAVGLVGLLLVIWGYVGWRRRQFRIDQGEDYDVESKRAQFEQLTAREVDEKLDREAGDEISPSDLATDDTSVPSSGPMPPPTDRPGGPSAREEYTARRARIESSERLIAELARAAFSDSFDIQSNLRIRSSDSFAPIVDVLAQPRVEGSGAFSLELKVVTGTRGAFLRAGPSMVAAALTGRLLPKGPIRFRSRRTAVSSSVVVLVLDEPLEGRALSRLHDEVARTNEILRVPVPVVVLVSDSLETMPSAVFGDVIKSALENGDVFMRLG